VYESRCLNGAGFSFFLWHFQPRGCIRFVPPRRRPGIFIALWVLAAAVLTVLFSVTANERKKE